MKRFTILNIVLIAVVLLLVRKDTHDVGLVILRIR